MAELLGEQVVRMGRRHKSRGGAISDLLLARFRDRYGSDCIRRLCLWGLHVIDPSTGRPLPPRMVSVRVLQDNAMLADAWATALTLLRAHRGLALADREGIAARFVERLPGQDPAFAETISAALARMIED